MPQTPVYALRYPAGPESADVVTDMNELATDVERAIGDAVGAIKPSLVGTFAARPTPASAGAGAVYYATDRLTSWYSNGTTWTLVQNGQMIGTAASRPTPASAGPGVVYYASDTREQHWSDGTSWINLLPAPPSIPASSPPPIQYGAYLNPGSYPDGQMWVFDFGNKQWQFMKDNRIGAWRFIGGPHEQIVDGNGYTIDTGQLQRICYWTAPFTGDYQFRALIITADTNAMYITISSSHYGGDITGWAQPGRGGTAEANHEGIRINGGQWVALDAHGAWFSTNHPANYGPSRLFVTPLRVY